MKSNDYADFTDILDNIEKKGSFTQILPIYSTGLSFVFPNFGFLFSFFSMSAIGSALSTPTTNTTSATSSDRMNELTMSDFIEMMVAELENQDPMNPMSNTEMLQQISQMRSISSNDRLTNGIESLTIGQALSTASGLIGKTVTGVDSLGEEITGKVDKVTIENGTAKLFVGTSIIEVGNVTSIRESTAA